MPTSSLITFQVFVTPLFERLSSHLDMTLRDRMTDQPMAPHASDDSMTSNAIAGDRNGKLQSQAVPNPCTLGKHLGRPLRPTSSRHAYHNNTILTRLR